MIGGLGNGLKMKLIDIRNRHEMIKECANDVLIVQFSMTFRKVSLISHFSGTGLNDQITTIIFAGKIGFPIIGEGDESVM